MDFRVKYLNKPIPIIDCNDCAYVSLTEEEQSKRGNRMRNHICLYYGPRLHHVKNLVNCDRLIPCDKCYKDDCKQFAKRGK